MRHAVDVCMATHALALAQRAGEDHELFARYADAHMSRTTPPVVAIGVRALLGNLRPARLPGAVRDLRALVRYYDSGEAASDTEAVRKERTERLCEELLRAVGAGDDRYKQLFSAALWG